MTKPSEAFGKNLKITLGDRSQTWLAEETGTTPAMISDYVKGKTSPNLKTAEKIADALGVSLAALIGDTPPKAIFPAIERLRLEVIALALSADVDETALGFAIRGLKTRRAATLNQKKPARG